MALTPNRSVERAVAVLEAVAHAGDASPTALARTTGLPTPTVLRLLATLDACGFVSRDADAPRYRIGAALLRVARRGDPYRALVDACLPIMRRLVKTTAETVTLAVPGDPETLETIAQVDSPQIIRDHHWVGAALPLHATSNGKLVLARWPDEALRDLALPRLTPRTITSLDALRDELARVRREGHAVCVDEAETGLAGLAVALTDRAGALVATLTVSGPTFRFGPDARSVHLASLRAAADEAVERLGL